MKGILLGGICIAVAFALAFIPSVSYADCAEDDASCWIKVLKKGEAPGSLKAAMILGNLQSEEAIDPLIDKLAHKDKYMATAAAYALGKIGAPATPALVEATKSKKASVRKYAVHALGQIGSDVYPTLSILARDDDPSVRLRALKAIHLTKDKRGMVDAVTALKDRQRSIKIEAIQLLADLNDPKCIEMLLKYPMIDLSPQVSIESAALLIKFGEPSVAPMKRKFDSQTDFVKTRYLYVLGEIAREYDDQEKKDELTRYLIKVVNSNHDSATVKLAAVSKLGDIGNPIAIPALKDLLKRAQGKKEYADLVQLTVRVLNKLDKM